MGHFHDVEPIGFAFFLGTLGYVAAKRSLHRDHQFSEIQKELESARRIQTSILPSAYPQSAHFHVATRYVPMTAVAGDFYDFLVADPTQAGLLIADVSGHGVPAALIASMVKFAATSQRANAADPALLLSGMNTVLYGNTQEQFVTAAYVYLDAPSAPLRYMHMMAKRPSQKSMASNLRLRKANATDMSPNVVKAAPRKRYAGRGERSVEPGWRSAADRFRT